MKIKVIGSGSMWNAYNSASYMIDNDILIDIPNGLCKNLLRLGINPQLINHLLITHFHGDHYFDIPFYFLLKSRAKNKDIKIYCSKEGKMKSKKLINLAFPDSKKVINENINLLYNFNLSFKINNYIVKKYLVNHGNMKPAFGYVFEDNNRNVGFTGDSAMCKNIEYIASICECLFWDCMLIKGNLNHLGIDNIKYLSKKYSNCKFIVSHLNDDTRLELKKIKAKNIIIAYDNLEIII